MKSIFEDLITIFDKLNIMKQTYLLLLLSILLSNCSLRPNYQLEDPDQIVAESGKMHELISQKKQYYYQGPMEIISGDSKGLVVRMDTDDDKDWDAYFGVYSEEKFDVNEKIKKGEIVFLEKVVLINSMTDRRVYLLKLGSDEEADLIQSKLPKKIRDSITAIIEGYGVHSHKGGTYDISKFVS